MVTRLSIPIRGHGKSAEEGQRLTFGRSVVKEETTQKLPDEDKKSAMNKKLKTNLFFKLFYCVQLLNLIFL